MVDKYFVLRVGIVVPVQEIRLLAHSPKKNVAIVLKTSSRVYLQFSPMFTLGNYLF